MTSRGTEVTARWGGGGKGRRALGSSSSGRGKVFKLPLEVVEDVLGCCYVLLWLVVEGGSGRIKWVEDKGGTGKAP